MSLLATKGSMLREKQVKAKKFSTKCKMPRDKVGPCLVVLFSSRWLPGLFVFYVASIGSKIFYSKFFSLFTPFCNWPFHNLNVRDSFGIWFWWFLSLVFCYWSVIWQEIIVWCDVSNRSAVALFDLYISMKKLPAYQSMKDMHGSVIGVFSIWLCITFKT